MRKFSVQTYLWAFRWQVGLLWPLPSPGFSCGRPCMPQSNIHKTSVTENVTKNFNENRTTKIQTCKWNDAV